MIVNFEKMNTIDVAKDFSRFPAGRFRKHGPFTGEALRDDLIIPALQNGPVYVDLTGVIGCAQSFLEETFGGLVRAGYSGSFLKDNLYIETTPQYLVDIWSFIFEENNRQKKGK